MRRITFVLVVAVALLLTACGGPADGNITARLYTLRPVAGYEPDSRIVTMEVISHGRVVARDHTHSPFRFSVAPGTYTFGVLWQRPGASVATWRCAGTAMVQSKRTTGVKVKCDTFGRGSAPG